MNAQPVDVLAVLDPDRYPLDTRQRERMCEARAAVAELIEAAADVADEHMGLAATTVHQDGEDEVGSRACCGVVSYEPHATDCPAVRLRAALARCGGAP